MLAQALRPTSDMTCLNIGSGRQSVPGFIDLDVSSPSYDHLRTQSFTEYDMRIDAIPFPDSTVDLIYCSHVIEHVEVEHVEKFIAEASRVLRRGGVLRIATPDIDFLHDTSSFDNSYWTWLYPTIRAEFPAVEDITVETCFVREVATARYFEAMGRGVAPVIDLSLPTKELCDALTDGLVWDSGAPWQHISWWSYERIRAAAGSHFRHCIRSKFAGSVSEFMRGTPFDLNNPQMSLYVDLVR